MQYTRQCPGLLMQCLCALQLVKGVMWAFEQPQNLAGSNVHTNVRMTALRLSDGSLLIYAPIAPTRQARSPAGWVMQIDFLALHIIRRVASINAGWDSHWQCCGSNQYEVAEVIGQVSVNTAVETEPLSRSIRWHAESVLR